MKGPLSRDGALYLRLGAIAVVGLLVVVGRRFAEAGEAAAEAGVLSPRLAAGLVGFGIVGGLGLVFCAWTFMAPARLVAQVEAWAKAAGRLPAWIRWVACVLCWLAASVTVIYPEGHLLHNPATRILLVVAGALAASVVMPAPAVSLPARIGLGVLIAASAFAAGKKLILVTSYPFATGWSEGNRLWDYSLYFGRQRFLVEGTFSYPSYLTPGRHGLWGLIFLWPGVDIFAARLWDAVLWIAPAIILGLVLARKWWVSRFGKSAALGFVLWTFLFLSQGPIYAPLVVSAIFLAWGFSRSRRWRTALVVGVACFYAGISRWTWLMAPAIWAVMWALLDTEGEPSLRKRLPWPVALGAAGLGGAALSQVFIGLAFPQGAAPYATAAAQDLLWYRLLPNPTNSYGVLLGLLLAVGPVVAVGLVGLRTGRAPDGWSRTGILGGLLAFLAVGLVASVKIGGGSNLHNLDMFLVGLVMLAGVLGVRADGKAAVRRVPLLLALVVAVPSVLTLESGGALDLPSQAVASNSLTNLQSYVTEAAKEGEVLFIDQRQLFSFGNLPGVPLVMDYELKDLMNQAMAHNAAYLDRFYADLAAGRFVAIIADPMTVNYQGRSYPFGEENDAWVRYVSEPLLEAYEPGLRLDEVGVWVYRPKR